MENKKVLEKEFFARVPKARRINPFFRSVFEFMYEAHLSAGAGKRLLNVYSSNEIDKSGDREELYHEKFFNECDYDAIDFWKDNFIYKGKEVSMPHTLPFEDKSFDVLVTTKYIMEHVSRPEKVIQEFYRVLRPDGEAFVAASLVRRQHQKPYDYFRYTEFALENLFKKAGFKEIFIKPTNGAMATFAEYFYFFQRGLGLPKAFESFFDFMHYWVISPAFFFLDRFDNGYGRDLTQYFLVRAKK